MSSTITALTSGGGLAMAGDTSGQLELKTNNGTTAMTIDTSQNVGIGTSSVASGRKFQVEASGDTVQRINSGGASNGVALEITNAGTVRGTVGNGAGAISGGSATTMAVQAVNELIFASGGYSEKARFDTSGNLLVGTTNTSASAGAGIKLNAGANPALAVVGAASTNGDFSHNLYSTGAGAYRFYVGYGGTVYATSTSISAISDQSLKENIKDLETGLPEVLALKPRRFDWKNGDATNVAGFIAQEVEEILPELVSDYKYSQDENGNDVIKKSLKMGDILPTLVKAIQELNAKVEAQATEIKALKGVA